MCIVALWIIIYNLEIVNDKAVDIFDRLLYIVLNSEFFYLSVFCFCFQIYFLR